VGELSDRVSHAEREETVVSLRGHLLAGRLTLDEFTERVELAYRARTSADLVRAGEDLPKTALQAGRSPRKPTRFTGAFFGRVVRRGRFRLRRWTFAFAGFADVDLDLREAEIENPQTGVIVLAAFGNVDVYVPEGVNVDVAGITIFGHRREWGRDVASADAPTVRVRTLGLFGAVDVWRVPHQMHGSYSELFRQLQELQRELPA
jgi:Domain of unknown function (DUF1707)/Cell wall-active antibiotics response 4TMS YvqF